MAGLGGRSILSRMIRRDLDRSIPRRGMAGGHTEPVSWAQYRSGEKTYMDFQNANRPYFVLGTWGIVALIVIMQKRSGKKKAAKKAALEEAQKQAVTP